MDLKQHQHVLAAFSHRLLLSFVEDSTPSIRLQSQLVRDHMRILVNASWDDVTKIITKSPSEPILSIVAANELNKDYDAYCAAIKTLI